MMTNDGGPAFPHVIERFIDSEYTGHSRYRGMSLRDWFAAQALAGAVSARSETIASSSEPDTLVAQVCYRFADAMLAEREKESSQPDPTEHFTDVETEQDL